MVGVSQMHRNTAHCFETELVLFKDSYFRRKEEISICMQMIPNATMQPNYQYKIVTICVYLVCQ